MVPPKQQGCMHGSCLGHCRGISCRRLATYPPAFGACRLIHLLSDLREAAAALCEAARARVPDGQLASEAPLNLRQRWCVAGEPGVAVEKDDRLVPPQRQSDGGQLAVAWVAWTPPGMETACLPGCGQLEEEQIVAMSTRVVRIHKGRKRLVIQLRG